jgi:hypothetical protein
MLDNASVALVFQARDTALPVMSFHGFVSAVQVLTEGQVSVVPHCAETKTHGYQVAVQYFMGKTTKDYLVFLDAGVSVPSAGIEYLIKSLRSDSQCGTMCALTFWWPRAVPNLYKSAGTERFGGYSFPQYAPAMNVVGRYVTQYQNVVGRGSPLLVVPPEVVDVDTFNGGLFVISREVLEKMGPLVFHERKGHSMGAFADKLRSLGLSVKAALNIICAAGGVNHVDFLSLYGREVKEDGGN